MRTTVTLDPDTEALVREEMALKRVSFKVALNTAIRQGFQAARATGEGTVRVSTFKSAYQPGIDRLRLNQLADELETEAFATASGKRS
jgi:hypothetical protein